MAYNFDDRLHYQQLMVPRLVSYLRMLRSIGLDARATAKSRWDSSSQSILIVDLGASTIAANAFTPEEFNAFVDAAMLQL